jgi:hypothetical protein
VPAGVACQATTSTLAGPATWSNPADGGRLATGSERSRGSAPGAAAEQVASASQEDWIPVVPGALLLSPTHGDQALGHGARDDLSRTQGQTVEAAKGE